LRRFAPPRIYNKWALLEMAHINLQAKPPFTRQGEVILDLFEEEKLWKTSWLSAVFRQPGQHRRNEVGKKICHRFVRGIRHHNQFASGGRQRV